MNRTMLNGAVALAAACGLMAQQPAAPPAKPAPAQAAPAAQASPVAKPPQVKSKGEAQAVQAMFQAKTPDERIKAADALIVKYADTQFKPLALLFATMSAEQKGDFAQVVVYGERLLQADPKNYQGCLILARNIAQRTREFDLDREEKLAKVEKYVKQAEEALKAAPRPRPDITDAQWAAAKKDLMTQGNEALGLAAMARKNYDGAIAQFKIAVESASQPDPATMVRLGAAYNLAGKYDQAIPVLDKVLAMTDVHPAVKQFAQAEKARAVQAKGGGAKPAAPAPTTVQPGTVQIKQP